GHKQRKRIPPRARTEDTKLGDLAGHAPRIASSRGFGSSSLSKIPSHRSRLRLHFASTLDNDKFGSTRVVEYQNLTADELLHVAEERERLTQEARLALDGELYRRKLSPSDIDSYRVQREAADKADRL